MCAESSSSPRPSIGESSPIALSAIPGVPRHLLADRHLVAAATRTRTARR